MLSKDIFHFGSLLLLTFVVAIMTLAILVGCSTVPSGPPPAVSFVVDVYHTEEGFFIVTRRGLDDSLAIKFNAEILRTDKPIEIKP